MKDVVRKQIVSRLIKTAKAEKFKIVLSDRALIVFERKIFRSHTIVYVSFGKTISVSTVVDHPFKGRTKMVRENLDERNVRLLLEIIKNPRTHCPHYIKSTYQ